MLVPHYITCMNPISVLATHCILEKTNKQNAPLNTPLSWKWEHARMRHIMRSRVGAAPWANYNVMTSLHSFLCALSVTEGYLLTVVIDRWYPLPRQNVMTFYTIILPTPSLFSFLFIFFRLLVASLFLRNVQSFNLFIFFSNFKKFPPKIIIMG